MARLVPEEEFRETFLKELDRVIPIQHDFEFVTGPGRSGAIASVYASHYLGVPFLPYGAKPPEGSKVLVVDTASQSGRTLRKACRKYEALRFVFAYTEPPRVKFWYEENKYVR